MTYNSENTEQNAQYDVRILQSLRKIIRAVDLHSRKLTKNHKITAPQLVCLLVAAEHGPLTVAGLAKYAHLSSSTVVGILDRLEEKQLVLRKRGIQDRRKVLVEATDLGRQYAKDAPSPLQDKLEDSLKQLSPLEQSTICLSLERIVTLMQAEDIEVSQYYDAMGSFSSEE
jgi:DNA-binding MarR family transcriptional regulator